MPQFDPTYLGKQNYIKSGMNSEQYAEMRLGWLKQQAAAEGREYKPGYVPRGYTKIYASPLAEGAPRVPEGFTEANRYNPPNQQAQKTMYWKPEAYHLYRKDLPAVPWDTTKDIQNYWHNPTNVVSWINRLRVQDETYQPPDWLDTDFLETQYDALKNYNDGEDDPLYWKPLPFGSEEAYLTNYVPDPNGNIPIYDAILKEQTQYEGAAARLRRQVELAEMQLNELKKEEEAKAQAWLTEVNTAPDAATVVSKLSEGVGLGYVDQSVVDDSTKYFQEQGLYPLEDGSFLKAPDVQPEGGDYLNLYPWQRFVQTVGGQVAMENQPELSKVTGQVIGAALPAVGIWGMGNMLINSIVALKTTGTLIGGAAALAATPAAPFVAAGLAILGIGTFAYLMANKNNPNNSVVQSIFRAMNQGAEVPERIMGAINVASEVRERGDEVDWSAAYDAGYMQYEMEGQPIGNFLFNTASLISEGIDRVGLMFGKDWDLSSGETATGNEIWDISKGYAEPQEAEIDLAGEGMLMSYDQMLALGDNRTRDELEQEWAYLTSLTGTGGTWADFMGQSFVDFTNLIPAGMDAGAAKYADNMSRKAAAAGQALPARAWNTFAEHLRANIGNLLVDALPMGVQTIAENILKGWDSRIDWMTQTKMLQTNLDYKAWKAANPTRVVSKWARGTTGLPDALHGYMAHMATGYEMPNSQQFFVSPGGRVADTISFEVSSDGTLDIYNIDGKRNWHYTPDMLDKIDVKLFTDKDGKLVVVGATRLLKDIGLDNSGINDTLPTTLSWNKPVDPDTGQPMPDPVTIDATNIEYGNVTEDGNHYTARIGDRQYVVTRGTDYVTRMFDENNNEIPIDKPMRMSEHAQFLGDDVMTPDQVQIVHDMIVMTGQNYARFIPTDYKSSKELDLEGIRAHLTSIKIPGVDKIIKGLQQAADLTPGTKAMIESQNAVQTLQILFYFSGNNFELTMNGLKKMIGAVQVGRVSKAAEAFLGSGTMTAAAAAGLKHVFADGSLLDVFVDLYKDTRVDRATLTKIANSLDVKPEKMLDMKAEDIFNKLKNKLAPKKDDVSRQIMQSIADGTMTAAKIDELLQKYTGKNAMPLTDQGFLASVSMAMEKKLQDFLIEKYGVKKLPVWERLSGMKKAMLSPFLIAFPYTTWMSNLYSNIGAQFFLTGRVPLQGRSGMEKIAKAIGLENMPVEYSSRMGLASDVMDTVNKISLTMNPMDNIGTLTRKIRNFGGAIKAYSAIEKYNTASLFVQQVIDLHSRILLPKVPENIRRDYLAKGGTDQQLNYYMHIMNGKMNATDTLNAFIEGVEYDAVDQGLFEDVGKRIFPNDPDNAKLYQDLTAKLFDNDDFVEALKKIEEPDDLDSLVDIVTKSFEDQIDLMQVNGAMETIQETQNIYTKEGMAGGISVFTNMLTDEFATRYRNSASWGEAKAKADLAAKAGEYGLHDRIIRAQREKSNRVFARSAVRIESFAKGLVDALKPGDEYARRFMDVVTNRHKSSSELMKKIQSGYDNYFDAKENMSVDEATRSWADLSKKNSALMDEFYKLDAQALQDLSDVFVELLGKGDPTVLSKSGLTSAELQAGGRKLMKAVTDGFKDLNKMVAEHYAGQENMSYNERIGNNLLFWNTQYQAKVVDIWSSFIDGNWQEFFKTKTDFEKGAYPETALVGETLPKAKVPTKGLSEAEKTLANSLAASEFDDAARVRLEAAKVASDAKHIEQLWWRKVLDAVGDEVTDEQKAIVEAMFETYDASYTRRTGKPRGSWYVDNLKVDVIRSPEYELAGTRASGYVTPAAAITQFDVAKKVWEVTIARHSDFTTALREIDRVIFQTDLLSNVDKAIIAREFGDLDFETFIDIDSRIRNGGSVENRGVTKQELMEWSKVQDGFANAHRRWLIQEAPKVATSPRMITIFQTLSTILFDLFEHIRSKINRVKMSDSVKQVFEVLHDFQNGQDAVSRNVGRMAAYPQGKPIVLNKFVRTVETIDGVRTAEAVGVAKGVNAGIATTLERLNGAGYKTYKSSSGMPIDYPGIEGSQAISSPKRGYISFKRSELNQNRMTRIENAAIAAGLEVYYTTRDKVLTLEVFLPVTKDLSTTAKLNAELVEKFGAKPEGAAGDAWQKKVDNYYKKLVAGHGGYLEDNGIIADLWDKFGEALVKKPKAVKGEAFQAIPKVISIDSLYSIYKIDPDTKRVSINKKFASDEYPVPPKKYTITELREMARALDPHALLVEMRKKGTAAILVDKRGMVVDGNDTVLALLYAMRIEPDIFKRYQTQLQDVLSSYGFKKDALGDIQDGVLVMQVSEGWDRTYTELGDDVAGVSPEDMAKNTMRLIDSIDDKVYPYLYDKASLKKTIVTTADQLKTLVGLKQEILDAYKRVQALKEQGVTTSFEDHLSRLDSANRGIQAEIDKLVKFKNASDAKTPGMMQTADEVSSKSWYYWNSRKVVSGLKQNIFMPDQLRAAFELIKKSERRVLDLDGFLEMAGEKITKQDVLAWIESHCLDIEEVEFSETAGWDTIAGTNYRDLYNLPGSEGYRELLITAPSWGKNFYSAHWTPKNVLAHIRFDIRIDPTTGKKVLNILEIQSDWVQSGKRAGFRGDSGERLVGRATKIFNELVFDPDPKVTGIDVDDGVYVYYKRKGNTYKPAFEIHGGIDETGAATYGLYVPGKADPITPIKYPTLDLAKDAAKSAMIDMYSNILDYRRPWEPPLKEFGMLALKRMLRYAVDDGYDSITFSTAKTIAEIENAQIFKDVRTITYNENDWTADITSSDGNTVTIDLDNDDYALSKYIGDELSGKVMQQSLDKYGRRTLNFAEPIELSGEKFADFYDKILVRDFNQYLKQWGIKIEDGEIAIDSAGYTKGFINNPRFPEIVPEYTVDQLVSSVMSGEDIWRLAVDGTSKYLSRDTAHLIFDPLSPHGEDMLRTYLETIMAVGEEGLFTDSYIRSLFGTEGETRTVHKVTFNDDLKSDVVVKAQPLMQTADEVPPTMPITERPVGSEPVHMNRGSALSELMEYDIPKVVEAMLDEAKGRMRAGKRETYKINVPEEAKPVLNELTAWAAEQQKLRMATILEGANRISKDIMIDYGRKRGIDAVAEPALPFQYWYTRSMLMWMKRMVAKPSIMAMAYRYAELRRRNEMTGFPTRLGGKSLVYTPWLPDSMGDWMGINPWSKFFTPEQLFQPLQNYASLDADVATEAQRYIYSLVQQGTVSPEAGKDAIRNKRGQIWEDAVQYTRMNTMPNETDPFTMANMFINTDPMVNALYQFSRGTPEKISPLPLTRIGNSFEAIGDGDIIGIIGAILSAPEDWAREKVGLPQAGEYGDYYVDFALSNMSTTGKYSVEEIKKAMISRQGQAFDEATRWAQQYIALRTPGTAFYKAIKDGHWREPNVLASAFLMSFLPSGLFPDGEMELRGLKDEYNAAWSDYERGDTEALEKFNNKYPEYQTRMMMFQEPTERLRSHLINIIWDTYTKLPTANQQIAADTLGDSFKAYFLNTDTRNYDKIDERTLTTWARKLGYQAPAMPGVNEQAATDTVDPMKYYPEDTAATVQTFIDERRTKFPDYYVYQSVYFKLPEEQREAYLKKFPIVKDYWEWKDEYVKQNPIIKTYLEDRAAASDSYETEYDVEAVQSMLMGFDSQLAEDVVYYQFTGEPMKAGTKAALKALFDAAGKPGGDFNIWLQVILGE